MHRKIIFTAALLTYIRCYSFNVYSLALCVYVYIETTSVATRAHTQKSKALIIEQITVTIDDYLSKKNYASYKYSLCGIHIHIQIYTVLTLNKHTNINTSDGTVHRKQEQNDTIIVVCILVYMVCPLISMQTLQLSRIYFLHTYVLC